MKAADIFPLTGTRVRTYAADHCIVADDLAENDFVALTLSVGARRDKPALQSTGERIFAAGQAALSVGIRVIGLDLS